MSQVPFTRKTLLDKTLDLLEHRDRTVTFEEISRVTGISYHWIAALAKKDSIRDPSVNKIQLLYEYLSQTPLQY